MASPCALPEKSDPRRDRFRHGREEKRKSRSDQYDLP
jgi:hypothetical protein